MRKNKSRTFLRAIKPTQRGKVGNSSTPQAAGYSIKVRDKLKILIVDDEPDLCWILDQTLRDDGHKITKIESGKMARQVIKDLSFDLAFIDIRLPDEDGFNLAKLFKRNNPGAKVVIISGYYYPEDERFVGKDIDGFISKPFDLDRIDEMVQPR